MKSSLIPEHPILVYPSLAVTLGLEEAVLLSTLNTLSTLASTAPNNGFVWLTLPCQPVQEALPFWSMHDIARVCNSLRDKGVLLIGSTLFGKQDTFKYAFNERATHNAQAPNISATQPSSDQHHSAQNRSTQNHSIQHRSAHNATQNTPARNSTANNSAHAQKPPTQAAQKAAILPPHITLNETQYDEINQEFGKNYLGAQWRPSTDTLNQLAQHGIGEAFAMEQLASFVTYWRERKEAHRSWGAKFVQHTMFKWRDYQAAQAKKDLNTAMTAAWKPSPDAMDVLTRHAGISRDFVEDAIPEFVLYWQERGDAAKTWNSKFIQHVRMQWNKFTRAIEHHTEPHPISATWQPSNDVYDILRLANIDTHFAKALIPEFILYWKESNQVHHSWNTRFLQHAKRQWAKNFNHAPAAQGQSNDPSRSTRDISIEEQLNDRSWAI